MYAEWQIHGRYKEVDCFNNYMWYMFGITGSDLPEYHEEEPSGPQGSAPEGLAVGDRSHGSRGFRVSDALAATAHGSSSSSSSQPAVVVQERDATLNPVNQTTLLESTSKTKLKKGKSILVDVGSRINPVGTN